MKSINPIKVLVTGVGATPAICAIESLRLKFKRSIFVIGTDSNPYAAGIYLQKYVDRGILIPRVDEGVDQYLAAVKEITKSYKVDFVFPATDSEIVVLKKYEYQFEPAKVIASDLETLEICTDKWLTYEILKPYQLMVESWMRPEDVSFPCIIKPRKSQGSKNVFIANNMEEFNVNRRKIQDPIFQRMLSADEYTVDCIFNTKGKLIGAVPRRRIVVAGGTAIITETVRDNFLVDVIKKLSEIIFLKGQINVQFIQNMIIEINPRVAGASILSTYAGINMPAISLLDWYGKRVKKWYAYKDKILTRYFKGIYLDRNKLKSFDLRKS